MKTATARVFRALFLVFSLLTAAWGVFAYVPFTFQQVVVFGAVPGLPTFARAHALLQAGFFVSFVSVLGGRLLRGPGRLAVWLLLGSEAIATVAFAVRPLPRFPNAAWTLGAGLAALIPPVLLAWADLAAARDRLAWHAAGLVERPAFVAGLLSLLFAGSIHGLLAARQVEGGWRTKAACLLWSLILHAIVGLALWASFLLTAALCATLPRSAQIEFVAGSAVVASLVAYAVASGVLPVIGLGGTPALLTGVGVGLAIGATVAGMAVQGPRQVEISDGLGLWLGGVALGARERPGSRILLTALLAALAAFSVLEVPRMDWNRLAQQGTTLVVWLVGLAVFYSGRKALSFHGAALYLLLVLPVPAYRFLGAEGRWPALWGLDLGAWQTACRSLEAHDPSFLIVHRLLEREERPPESIAFYRFLAENTNLPRGLRVEPKEIELVHPLTTTLGARPHIFIFIIDSLRQDYVAPYNPKVSFTPNIAAFATESTVFRQAFTSYGGTGLSEPSIWTGGLLLHKQYVTPFRPMNTLLRLIEVDGYRSFVSLDSILETVTGHFPGLEELDRGVQNRDYGACNTLDELASRLPSVPRGQPVFAYSQPQDLHVAQIARQGASVPAGESYPGFYAPYASRLRRVDACFGRFVESLKTNGLYDDSIVILSSDHGDSLGEGGHWGHAYRLAPEIVRIPLVVHLPASMRTKMRSRPDLPSFLIDLTPTLYYLLGHRPVVQSDILGQPLFLEGSGEDFHRRDHYLMASSYGAVFGSLSGDGRELYVADGVEIEDRLFRLAPDGGSSVGSIDAPLQAARRATIRSDILNLGKFYGFRAGS